MEGSTGQENRSEDGENQLEEMARSLTRSGHEIIATFGSEFSWIFSTKRGNPYVSTYDHPRVLTRVSSNIALTVQELHAALDGRVFPAPEDVLVGMSVAADWDLLDRSYVESALTHEDEQVRGAAEELLPQSGRDFEILRRPLFGCPECGSDYVSRRAVIVADEIVEVWADDGEPLQTDPGSEHYDAIPEPLNKAFPGASEHLFSCQDCGAEFADPAPIER